MSLPNERAGPGWLDVLVGLFFFCLFFLGGRQYFPPGLGDPVALNAAHTFLAGLAGLGGFLSALFLCERSWTVYGVRPTTWHWIIIGASVGFIAFCLKELANLNYVAFPISSSDIFWRLRPSDTRWIATLAALLLTVFASISEELLFRGLITSALLRYGRLSGVLCSSFIFAIFHGFNMVFFASLVTGFAAAEVFRLSRSIWPAAMVHFTANLPIPIIVLISGSD
jgi:membrane protease YdiL (CAAX protease family)